MPSYDPAQFNPPAPVAYVTLRNPDTRAESPDVLMLLDTGADITLVPVAAVAQLGLSATNENPYELEGFDGKRSWASAVRLDLIFCHRTFRGRFLLVGQTWGILDEIS